MWTWRDVTVFVSRARWRRCSCWRVKAVAGLWLWKLSLWPVMCHGAVWCSRKLRLLNWMTLIIFFNSKQVVCVPKTKTRWKLVKAKWENALTTDSSSSFLVQSQVFVPKWPFYPISTFTSFFYWSHLHHFRNTTIGCLQMFGTERLKIFSTAILPLQLAEVTGRLRVIHQTCKQY